MGMLDRQRMLEFQAEREDADRKFRTNQRKDDVKWRKDQRSSDNKWHFAEVGVLAMAIVVGAIVALVAANISRDPADNIIVPSPVVLTVEVEVTPVRTPVPTATLGEQ